MNSDTDSRRALLISLLGALEKLDDHTLQILLGMVTMLQPLTRPVFSPTIPPAFNGSCRFEQNQGMLNDSPSSVLSIPVGQVQQSIVPPKPFPTSNSLARRSNVDTIIRSFNSIEQKPKIELTTEIDREPRIQEEAEDEAPRRKKTKYMSKYLESWENEFNNDKIRFLTRGADDGEGYCNVCKRAILVKHMGKSAVVQHVGGRAHSANMEAALKLMDDEQNEKEQEHQTNKIDHSIQMIKEELVEE